MQTKAISELPPLYEGGPVPKDGLVRLRGGVVGEEEIAAGWVTLTVSGRRPRPHTFADSFTLKTEDGAEITVHCGGAYLRPEEQRRASWGELESLVEATPFRKEAPGPHIKATLKKALLRGGQTVEVVGKVAQFGFVPGSGSLREPAKQCILALDAILIGAGKDPARALEEAQKAHQKTFSPPENPKEKLKRVLRPFLAIWSTFLWGLRLLWRKRRLIGILLVGAVSAFFLSGPLWLPSHPFVFSLCISWGLGLLSFLAFWAYRQRPLPEFRTLQARFYTEKPKDDFPGFLQFMWCLIGIGFAIVAIHEVSGLISAGETPPSMLRTTWKRQISFAVFWGVGLAWLVVSHVRRTFPAWRVARVILRASRAATPQEGQWSALEGEVSDDTAVMLLGERAALGYLEIEASGEVEISQLNKTSFTLKTPHPVEVYPEALSGAAPPVSAPPGRKAPTLRAAALGSGCPSEAVRLW